MNGQQPKAATGRYAQITGWGMYVPEKVLTNADLARAMDTTDEWIISHTGIKERRIVNGERESTATLATRAAQEALLVADVAPADLGLVIVATVTPEYAFPATASLVQDALGADHAGAFDLSAGCSGFMYALSLAADVIRAGGCQHVLVIGAETLSRIVDWTDRNTCVLFGDGAGAVVVSACEVRCGVLATVLGSDGSGGDALILPAGGSHAPASHETVSNGGHFVKMNGREVYRFATTILPKAVEQVVQQAGWQTADLALVVPHQANTRIIESAAKRLNVPLDKVFINLERYGNTSTASIPIALCEAIRDQRIKAGDKLALVGFGAGLTWAAVAIEWGIPMPVKPQPRQRQWFGRLRFTFAGVRSIFRRVERRLYNWLMGPVGKDNWRGKLRQRTDALRERLRRK
jgi:3-oxoacyl-[acyl-carrier-protein] synthase-3